MSLSIKRAASSNSLLVEEGADYSIEYYFRPIFITKVNRQSLERASVFQHYCIIREVRRTKNRERRMQTEIDYKPKQPLPISINTRTSCQSHRKRFSCVNEMT